MTALKNPFVSKLGLGSGFFSASPFDFVFFGDILDTLFSYLEYPFPFRQIRT